MTTLSLALLTQKQKAQKWIKGGPKIFTWSRSYMGLKLVIRMDYLYKKKANGIQSHNPVNSCVKVIRLKAKVALKSI